MQLCIQGRSVMLHILKKKIYFFIFVIIILILLIFCIEKNIQKKSNISIIRNIDWDKSYNEIVKIENKNVDVLMTEKNKDSIRILGEVYNQSAYITYKFIEKRLNNIEVEFVGNYDEISFVTYKTIINEYEGLMYNFNKKVSDDVNEVVCKWNVNKNKYKLILNEKDKYIKLYINK